MADPLSISAGVVGLIVPVLHGTRLLLDDLEKITNAPDAVQQLREDVNSIITNLDLLRNIEDPVWASLGPAVTDTSKATIKSCATACGVVQGDLQRWTRHSKGGTLSWLDRVNVGFFRDQRLKAHSDRLHALGLTFSSTVGMATLYSSIRNSQLTDDVRKSIASQQNSIVAASSATQTEVAVVQRTLAGVQSRSTVDLSAEEEGDLDATVVSLDGLMEALTLSQTLLQELLAKTDAAETAKAAEDNRTTTITFGTNYQGMQMANNYGTTNWNS